MFVREIVEINLLAQWQVIMVPVDVINSNLARSGTLELVKVHGLSVSGRSEELLVSTGLLDSAKRPLGGAE